MARISVRDRLFLLTTIAGAAFVATYIESSTLDFFAVNRAFPSAAPAFVDQRGFVSVLRWAESLHTHDDVAMFVRMVAQTTSLTTSPSMTTIEDSASASRDSATTASSDAQPAVKSHLSHTRASDNSSSSSSESAHSSTAEAIVPLDVQLTQIVSVEAYMHLSKTLLQCGVLLSLYRANVLSRRRAVLTLCLCFLVLLCWKIGQSCLYDLLSPRTVSRSAYTTSQSHEMTAALLNMLFLLRFAGAAVVNVVLGRAYQRYFCAPWPASWRRVPRYLGSKDLVLTTLYLASSCVALMSVSCTALRSLSEAAMQFEAAALTGSLLHCVYIRSTQPPPDNSRKQI